MDGHACGRSDVYAASHPADPLPRVTSVLARRAAASSFFPVSEAIKPTDWRRRYGAFGTSSSKAAKGAPLRLVHGRHSIKIPRLSLQRCIVVVVAVAVAAVGRNGRNDAAASFLLRYNRARSEGLHAHRYGLIVSDRSLRSLPHCFTKRDSLRSVSFLQLLPHCRSTTMSSAAFPTPPSRQHLAAFVASSYLGVKI